jgi:phosphoserine phosphatase
VAIGDGTNDLKAHLSIAFHAKPVVRARADCVLSTR